LTVKASVDLYPEIQPFETARLEVSGLHSINVEQYGNLHGQPLLFLHGGPGSGVNSHWLRLFNPQDYRMVTFDQRGCGKSLPYGCLEENTTQHLVDDIEKIRRNLQIDSWHIAGGSWGCTLALAYAEKHPQFVNSLILWGIFLGRKQEVDWCYQRGANAVFADAWEGFLKPIPISERDNLVKAYYARLTSPDKKIRVEAAKSWCIWDASVLRLIPNPQQVADFAQEEFAVAHALLECHYFVNQCFFNPEDQLLREADRIRHIPSTIIHARYDMMCPMETAWELHKALPEAEFVLVPDSGHSGREPGNSRAIIAASDKHRSYPAQRRR
jgi:proline iminopeptidase